MSVTAAALAQLLNGTVEGNPQAAVTRPMRIEEAGEGDFAFLDNPKYEHFAYSTQASILMVHDSFKPEKPVVPTLLRVSDVRNSLALLLEIFGAQHEDKSSVISAQAAIDTSATIGNGVSIGHFTVVEAGAVIGDGCVIHPQVFIGRNVQIGSGSILYPGVRIHHDCIIGSNCILHANAVIGADGFGFAPQPDQSWKKVPQVGNVVVGNMVEIGANTCIDRAALGSTLVHDGVKIDNLVHIAHNVEVGAHTALAAQVGIAGSSKIGAHCMLGGQAGIAGHLTLADGTKLQAQSGVASSITESGKAWFGSPAIDYGQFVRAFVVFKQLPDLAKKVRELEKKL